MSSRRPARSRVATAAAVVLALSGAVLVGTAFTGASPLPTEPPSPGATEDAIPGAERPSDRSAERDADRDVDRDADGRADERAERPSGRGDGKGVPDLVTGPVLARSEPVRLTVPRIGVTSDLVDLGLDATGAMEVPEDGALAGWYSRGPAPGSLGPAVIAGHVDWERAPAVFYRLGELRAGDRVEVSREDGTTAVFSVTRVATYAKARFPTRAVFGSTDHAGLRLITCGGDFDPAEGHYEDNVVAYAELVRG